MNTQISQLEERIKVLENMLDESSFSSKIFNAVLYSLELGNTLGIGIRSSRDSSAMLDVVSKSKGVCFPNMTTAQRTAIVSPKTGLLVFDTTIGEYYFYNGSIWGAIKGTM